MHFSCGSHGQQVRDGKKHMYEPASNAHVNFCHSLGKICDKIYTVFFFFAKMSCVAILRFLG